MTLAAENENAVASTLAAIRERIPDFRDDELHLNLAQVSAHFYGNKPEALIAASCPPPPERLSFWPPSRLAGSWLERRYRRLLPRFLETRRSPLPCAALDASIFVAPDGVVHPCLTDERVVGQLRKEDYNLRALLAGAEANRLRSEIAGGRCPHCWTPCEAFPTILEAAGLGRVLRLLR